jgi:hypothetical protein
MDIANTQTDFAQALSPVALSPVALAAPKKPIVRKTIPKKYLDYLKFAFVAMNPEGTFAEKVKLNEPVDNIINNVKAIVDNEELGERIHEMRKELLKKPREKKATDAPKASSKKRKTDSETVDGTVTPVSVPKTPRMKSKTAATDANSSPNTTLPNASVDGLTTPPATPTGKDAPKAPRKKAKSATNTNASACELTSVASALSSVANALTNDFAKAV